MYGYNDERVCWKVGCSERAVHHPLCSARVQGLKRKGRDSIHVPRHSFDRGGGSSDDEAPLLLLPGSELVVPASLM